METTKTHWKKNNDSKFISGEDLQSSLRGLAPEMIVVLDRFIDAKTFDQNNQKDLIVTSLYFKKITGEDIYKPVVLNNTNAKFMVKETGSPMMEDWIGKTVILFAQKDKRHGYVARLKSFQKINLQVGTVDFDNCKKSILAGWSIDKIKMKFSISAEVELKLLEK